MSTFAVEVVPVILHPHPNADSLSIVYVHGWQCVVRSQDFQDGQLAAYIPPDSIVPDTEEYSFLKGHRHIKAARLRGELSWGLLVPAPDGALVGDDVASVLNITHYEPEIHGSFSGGESENGPGEPYHVYDVESYYRFPRVLHDGELVVATEKIHGANGRWVYKDGRYYCGSHKEWKKAESESIWWRVLHDHKSLGDFLKSNEGYAIYGEVYGWVQSLHYGHDRGLIELAIFDVRKPTGEWLSWDALNETLNNPDHRLLHLRVPEVYYGPFNAKELKRLSDGPSLVPRALHEREGIVVKPATERYDSKIGRAQLKFVSPKFLEKNK